MMESVVSNSFEIKNEPIQVVPEVDEQTNESEVGLKDKFRSEYAFMC